MLPNKSASDIGIILLGAAGVFAPVLLLWAALVGPVSGQVLPVVLVLLGGFTGVALLVAALIVRATAADPGARRSRPWF